MENIIWLVEPFLSRSVSLSVASHILPLSLVNFIDNFQRIEQFIVNSSLGNAVFALLLVGSYLVTIMLVRWNDIAKSARHDLQSVISSSRARLNAAKLRIPEAGQDEKIKSKQATIKAAEELLTDAKDLISPEKTRLWDKIFWSRGQELACLHSIRKADRLLIDDLSTDELIVCALSLAYKLEREGNEEAKDLAEATKKAATTEYQPDQLRVWLDEVLRHIHYEEFSHFYNWLETQTRAMWVTTTALLLILGLALVVQNPLILLVGAVGGFLSRLLRILKAEGTPRPFGDSWPTLFISPLVGALAGWTGVMIFLATNVAINPQTTQQFEWHFANTPSAWGLAVLLGFSERFFDRLVSNIERRPPLGDAEAPVESGGTKKSLSPNLNEAQRS